MGRRRPGIQPGAPAHLPDRNAARVVDTGRPAHGPRRRRPDVPPRSHPRHNSPCCIRRLRVWAPRTPLDFGGAATPSSPGRERQSRNSVPAGLHTQMSATARELPVAANSGTAGQIQSRSAGEARRAPRHAQTRPVCAGFSPGRLGECKTTVKRETVQDRYDTALDPAVRATRWPGGNLGER